MRLWLTASTVILTWAQLADAPLTQHCPCVAELTGNDTTERDLGLFQFGQWVMAQNKLFRCTYKDNTKSAEKLTYRKTKTVST